MGLQPVFRHEFSKARKRVSTPKVCDRKNHQLTKSQLYYETTKQVVNEYDGSKRKAICCVKCMRELEKNGADLGVFMEKPRRLTPTPNPNDYE